MIYNEIVTFYYVKSEGYSGLKEHKDEADVPCIVIQNTSQVNSPNQENVDADVLLYPDPEHKFITDYANRLEGMYVLANIFQDTDSHSWFKVEFVNINRDHLLNNEIDNIELGLKKTTALPLVS